jgi:pimeloyl-ACP methyl ester carboxylesterase
MRTRILLSTAALLTLALPGSALQAAPAKVPAAASVSYRDAAAAMRQAGGMYATWAASGRKFLSFDASGDGTAAEVIGDLATADHIVVLIPGVDTTLRDFDRGLGGQERRAPAVQARSIYWKLRATDRAANVAVVAWLGYDTPEGIGMAAIRESRARDGANRLVAFVEDLRVRRPAAAVTLVAHSYGAIVAGLAAPRLPKVRDVVTMGAPGIGAGKASDLGGARVWSALAPADWIRRLPQIRLFDLGHGRRPSDPAFGAHPRPTAGVAGHDYYLVPESATLAAVTDVVLGRAS